jgi:hemerythrin superfamily protein
MNGGACRNPNKKGAEKFRLFTVFPASESRRKIREGSIFISRAPKEKTMQDGLFEQLHKDHETVKALLEKLTEGSARLGKSRESLFEKLKQEIMPHMKAEEKVFYPPLMEERKTRDDAFEAVEEHHVAELVLRELDRMPKSEERWKAKLAVFKEIVEHHIEEEEEKIFQDAREVFDQAQMNEIFEGFQKQKGALLNRMKRAMAA